MAIQIIGNVGNQGYALPMVSAYPSNIDLQQFLAWNPVAQALDYVPYTGNALGDFGVGRDLAVTRDASIARNLTVAGTTVLTGVTAINGGITPTDGSLEVTGSLTASGAVNTTSLVAQAGGNFSNLLPTLLSIQSVQVVTSRRTGWAAMTGTPLKTTFATGTITLPQLAGIVMALQADLIAHGLIGA